jgi:hypothetical protein
VYTRPPKQLLPVRAGRCPSTGLASVSISRLYDFNFGGHILIPVHHRITPYAVLAAGVLYNTYRISTVRPDGVVYLAGRSDCKFAFETILE